MPVQISLTEYMRLSESLKRLPQYRTDEDPNNTIELTILVLNRIADDIEGSKL